MLGFTVNTNAATLSRELARIGVNVYRQSVVGDNRARIGVQLQAALKRSDIVILTGGLGPTVDDITVEAVAKSLRRKCVFHRATWLAIQKRFRARSWFPHPAIRRQARVIGGAQIIINRYGSAPGQIIRVGKKYIVLLPGVPSEAKIMMQDAARILKKHLKTSWVIQSVDLLVTGITESAVQEYVTDLLKMKGAVTCGIYAGPQHVTLRLTAKARSEQSVKKLLKPCQALIKKRIQKYLYSSSGRTLEEVIGQILTRKKLTLAVAESCTGGLITNRLTDVSGSSRYLTSSVVAYSNKAKQNQVGIPAALIRRHGAVSAQVATALARGIRKKARTDLGLSITGIAGPGGGTKKKPVGLVFIALADPKGVSCEHYQFRGQRNIIKLKSAQAALDLVRRTLTK